jgi:MFS family permease
MVGVMTWTPLHMSKASGSGVIGLVLSGHLLGMYAFSPLLGWASARYGALRQVAVGAFVMLAALTLAALSASDQHLTLAIALFLLGVAWAQMFITGSSIVTENIAPPQRAAAQGLMDVAIGIASALSMAAGGVVISDVGYRWFCVLCLAAVAPVAAIAVALLRAAPEPARPGVQVE